MVAQPSLAQRDHDGAARLLDGGVGVEQRLLVRAEHREGAGRRQVPEGWREGPGYCLCSWKTFGSLG